MARTTRLLRRSEADPLSAPEQLPIFQIAWQRKWLIVLGLAVGLVLGALYYAQRSPVYESTAQIHVIRKTPDALPFPGAEPGLAYYEDYLSTHKTLIKSPVIVNGAVKKADLKSLKSFAGQSDPAGAIISALSVARDSKDPGESNNILNLSYRGPVADDCDLILNAIIESYQDYLDESYKRTTQDSVELITQARDLLEKDLKKKEEERQEFLKQSPLLLKGKDGLSSQGHRLVNIEMERDTLAIRRHKLQGHLAMVEAAKKAGQKRMALSAMIHDLSSRSGTDRSKVLEDQLLPLLLQEQMLLEDLGPDHPQVQAIRRRIGHTRSLFATMSAERGSGQDETALYVDTDTYIQSLKREINDVEAGERSLNEYLKHENEEAKKLMGYELEAQRLSSEIESKKQLYDSILKQLQEISITKDFGGYDAKVISPPGDGWMVEPKLFPILLAGGFLGILGGLGLAFLAHVTEKSFHTPEEIRRRLGLPVLGHIPYLSANEAALPKLEANGAALDPVLLSYYRPKSSEAEAYRSLRTALYFSTDGQEHRVIQVTSPNKGDGKSTLAANLAVSIAQSGKKVLLIDADFRRPRIHRMFGVSSKIGLASVIAGESQLAEAMQQSAVPGLWLLPCGPIPPNPAELLTAPHFKELLASLRESYDYVLVDTPPLLAVTDPGVVAARVDGVLLTIRISKNARPQAERAKEILSTVGAKVLGVIVNGLDRQAASGRYRHEYGYGYYRREGYYQEEAPAEPRAAPPPLIPTGREAPGEKPAASEMDETDASSSNGLETTAPEQDGLLKRLLRWW